MFKRNTQGRQKEATPEAPFIPDGEIRQDGSVRYKVLCDGGVDPSGVFWCRIVPAGASKEDYLAVQAERDEACRQLTEISGAP